ncbi:uncharacterized protein [Emydura macquarii macquarii]|uniref:uncharacterized protein isoform X4 n=1 Tax=Emydura macquarii macquarii TaxID=1129001 RepID=UPI003529DD1D
MAWDRCGPLLAQLARFGRLLELSCDVEEDCIRVARGFETCRRTCCRLGLDLRRAREQLLVAEAERSALQVRLEHARNQVRVEMKKRHRAEAELEKQERKLQLIYDFLMQDSLGPEQLSALALLDGQGLGAARVPGGRLAAVDESCPSLLSHSDISYDHTEDDVDLEVTVVKPLERKAWERPRLSLAPLIGPVVAAKRPRPSVLPAASASEPAVTPPAGAAAEGRGCSLPPVALVPCRRPRQDRHLATLTGYPPRVLLRLRLPRPLRAGGSAVPALPHAGAPGVPGPLPQLLRPRPPGLAPRGRPGRLRAPHGPAGACPGGAVRVRGGDQGPDGDGAVPGARRGAAGAGVEADAAACQGGAALAGPRGRRARGVRAAQGLLQGPPGAAGHLPPAPRLPAGRRHPGRGGQPGCPVPRGEQAAPGQPGHAGLPPAAPAQVMARLLSLPPEFWRRFVGKELENLVPTAVGDPLVLNERERLFRPLASPKMSPASCCLPAPLRSCTALCRPPGRWAGSSPPRPRRWTAPARTPARAHRGAPQCLPVRGALG